MKPALAVESDPFPGPAVSARKAEHRPKPQGRIHRLILPQVRPENFKKRPIGILKYRKVDLEGQI